MDILNTGLSKPFQEAVSVLAFIFFQYFLFFCVFIVSTEAFYKIPIRQF